MIFFFFTQLYTKSYEVFKKYNSTVTQGRLTLWIAYRIAHTYFESEKFDVAVRYAFSALSPEKILDGGV